MAMDIKQLQNQPRVNTGSVHKNTAQSSQTAQQGAAPQKADSVVVSQQAQQLQGVQSKMVSLPEIDQKKITEIKLAIAEGRYKVDPEKLAANISQFESELNELNKGS
ncbi:flagellar biosynthesis anti-sigma factor FlgM [Shewanella algae]|uniref:flagellar biosynthesis anti-sigma factor FlgM n=1 Tax=Shewanella algae TaxID=38313 RepID=UPI000E3347AE|nr:flagellar biosynthesis anti-sigma factor FlgM [Shewanella algae]AXQ15276.1 flagellar biosynthesis anti-sigma factor FlgM [Shewanella algae]QXP18196.1 flagellar biosynthesis anti-sigma factor FlgM [Shewanella algae]QXP31479.1 flagellar biosynthesis anti-sigma factor FlgM [Shewanella algae]QXP35263.1 flagellar biosynthesis anti-sigma factor FlgM [Shewanella algae]QXP36927.1 flagellar biosynthesis anti-sigma factor FlgM [Shewanella algae]